MLQWCVKQPVFACSQLDQWRSLRWAELASEATEAAVVVLERALNVHRALAKERSPPRVASPVQLVDQRESTKNIQSLKNRKYLDYYFFVLIYTGIGIKLDVH